MSNVISPKRVAAALDELWSPRVLAEVEAELDLLPQPQADAGGISFGKRVGDGTSIAVERIRT